MSSAPSKFPETKAILCDSGTSTYNPRGFGLLSLSQVLNQPPRTSLSSCTVNSTGQWKAWSWGRIVLVAFQLLRNTDRYFLTDLEVTDQILWPETHQPQIHAVWYTFTVLCTPLCWCPKTFGKTSLIGFYHPQIDKTITKPKLSPSPASYRHPAVLLKLQPAHGKFTYNCAQHPRDLGLHKQPAAALQEGGWSSPSAHKSRVRLDSSMHVCRLKAALLWSLAAELGHSLMHKSAIAP